MIKWRKHQFQWKHVCPLRGHQNETFVSPNSESSLNMSSFDEERVAFDDINAANIHFEDAMNIAHLHRAILRRYA